LANARLHWLDLGHGDFIHVGRSEESDSGGRNAVIHNHIVFGVNLRDRDGVAKQGGCLVARQSMRPELMIAKVGERNERETVRPKPNVELVLTGRP